jgi:hypothetical protein
MRPKDLRVIAARPYSLELLAFSRGSLCGRTTDALRERRVAVGVRGASGLVSKLPQYFS